MESIQNAIELAEENGNEDLVKQLKEFVIVQELPEGLEGATKKDVIKIYLQKHNPDWNVTPTDAFRCACQRCELEIAKWVYASFNLTIEDARADNNWALRLAAKYGHLEVVKYLIEKVYLTIEDARVDDNWALRWAVENGHLSIVKYLIEEVHLTIEDARARDNYGLRWAAYNGHLQVVKYLIEEVHLTIEDVRTDDNSALRHAACNGHLDIVKYLIKVFDILTPEDVNSWDKHWSRSWQERWPKEVVEHLQAEIAKKDFQKSLPKGLEGDSKKDVIKNYLSKHRSGWGITPVNAFQCACERGELEIAKWVYVFFNLTINDARATDNYALIEAAASGHLPVVKYLIEKVHLTIEDVRANDNYALSRAAYYDHLSVVKYLIKVFDILTPEDINSWDKNRKQSWHERWPKEIVEFLQAEIIKRDFQKSLPEGLEGNSKEDVIKNYLSKHQPDWQITPTDAFQCACEKGELKIAKWVYVSFNMTRKDARAWDNWALRYASRYGQLNVVKYLFEEVHLTIEDVWVSNNYALRFAAMNGHFQVVKYLIEEVDLTIEDARSADNASLRWAAGKGHLHVIKYLVNKFDILTPEDINSWDKNWSESWPKEVVEYLQAEIAKKNFQNLGLEDVVEEEESPPDYRFDITADEMHKLSIQASLDHIANQIREVAQQGRKRIIFPEKTLDQEVIQILESRGFKIKINGNEDRIIDF